MTMLRVVIIAAAVVSLLVSVPAIHAAAGRIEGRVVHSDGSAVSGVGVSVDGTRAFALTDDKGGFVLKGVRPGSYTLLFTLLDNTATRTDVIVGDGQTATIEQVVGWEVAFVETVTVTSVSRQRERLIDAPAAVTYVSEEQIERDAVNAQAPKLFEFTPGVDITQTSMVEFLVSTRGFNSTLNRRTPVLLDGRHMADPFVGAMEWPTVSLPLDDLSDVELLRGPSGALYGANATGGVVNLITRAPRDSLGGRVRLASGEFDSANIDVRWAGALGSDWYIKAFGTLTKSDGYSESRLNGTEYSTPCPTGAPNCLPPDAIPFPVNGIDVRGGGLRLDKYLADGTLFTIEGGTTDYDGPVFPTDFGRGQILDVKRPWARFNFNNEHWNVLAFYNGREAQTVNLTTTAMSDFDTYNYKLEFQTNWSLADNRVRLIGGGNYFEEKVDSTALLVPVDVDAQALFAQADWTPGRHVKLVGALRWDDSTLHDSRVSPRVAVVGNVTPRHVLRLSYNEGFQLPTYAEFFLYFPITGLDLSALENICATGTPAVDCGFDEPTTLTFLGNPTLEVEVTQTVEFGYRGVFGNNILLNLDLFESRNDNFVSRLVDQLTPGGRTNPNFGPWQGPEGISQLTEDAVRAASTGLIPPGSELTNVGGSSAVLWRTVANFGEVDVRGADLSLSYRAGKAWRAFGSYSWLDFEVQDVGIGQADWLAPNSPEHKAALGVEYVQDRWHASARGRWVDTFPWVNATYAGDVDSFTTVDLSGAYALSSHWKLGLYVANLFDDSRWEVWGGDLLQRRAMGYIEMSW